MLKVNKEETSKTAVNYPSTLVARYEQSLHLVSVLLPFSTSKFQPYIASNSRSKFSRNHNAARKLQLTATKATSKILRFSFPENKSGAIRTDRKVNSLLLYHLCIMITIFKLANIIFNIFNRKTSFESVILSKFQQ